MSNFNRVILMGRLTRDIDLKYLQSGTAVTEVGLAVSDRRKNQAGEWVEEPVFVDVTLWGRTAEIASEYLSKGSPIFIEGRLKLDTWETDGQKRSKLRVVGERMQLIGGRGDRQGGGERASSQHSSSQHSSSEHSSAQHDAGDQPQYSEPAATGSASAGSPPQDDIPF